jgi:hypothetical protein
MLTNEIQPYMDDKNYTSNYIPLSSPVTCKLDIE